MMDLHAGQVQGFFSATVDELTALPILATYFIDKKFDDWVVGMANETNRLVEGYQVEFR